MDIHYLAGEPCEKAIGPPTDVRRCGVPSLFLYRGFDPRRVYPEATEAELKRLYRRGNPCTMLLCPDHGRALAHDFSWYVRDHKIRIERLDVTKLRFRCPNCLISIAIEWHQLDTAALSANPGEFKYCPRCGVAGPLAWPDAEQDYVDWVAEQFDGMPRQLIEMLYQEWDRRAYGSFRDYVEAQVNQFDQTGEFEAAS